MKSILIFIAFGLASIQINAQVFEDSFREAFLKSVKGLLEFKGEEHGSTWAYAAPIAEMTKAEIVFLPERGLHALRITRIVENENTGLSFAARFDSRIQRVLPSEDYTAREETSEKFAGNIVRKYEPSNPDAKNQPVVEMATVKKGDHYELQILLIEPQLKNQYAPKI
jgi:hypothetical protein